MRVNIIGSGYMGKQISALLRLIGFDVLIWGHNNNNDLSEQIDRETRKLEKILKLEQLRALENNISLLVLNYEGKIHRGIDTPEDLSVIRKYLEGA